MKSLCRILGIVLVILISCLNMFSCEEDSKNKYSVTVNENYIPNAPIEITLSPYTDSISLNCNHKFKDIVTLNDGQLISGCIYCGYSDSGYKYYDNYSPEIGKGIYGSKLIIKTNYDFNDATITLSADMKEVIFVGTDKQIINNLTIKINNRSQDIQLSFYNVNIVANKSIISANNINSNVKLSFFGTSNSFVTKDGLDGMNGKVVYARRSDFMDVYRAQNGYDGENGADVFSADGNIELFVYSPLKIQGGNGGNGGNGATEESKGLYSRYEEDGCNGGNGGNGGAAIYSLNGYVFVSYKNENYFTFVDGYGGSKGLHGYDVRGKSKGYDGNPGEDAKTNYVIVAM